MALDLLGDEVPDCGKNRFQCRRNEQKKVEIGLYFTDASKGDAVLWITTLFSWWILSKHIQSSFLYVN